MTDIQRHLFGIELVNGCFREWIESRLVVNAGLDRGLGVEGAVTAAELPALQVHCVAALLAVLVSFTRAAVGIRRDAQRVSNAREHPNSPKPYKRRKCIRSDVRGLKSDSSGSGRTTVRSTGSHFPDYRCRKCRRK